MRTRFTIALVIAIGLTNSIANASSLPYSDPQKTSFTAFVDSGSSQNRVSGGASNILPVCANGSESWCIKSLEVSYDGSNYINANFVRYVDNGIRPPSPNQDIIPTKSAISIWSAESGSGKVNLYATHSVVGPNGIFSSSIYALQEIRSRFRDDVYNQMSYGRADYRLINPGYVDDCVFISQGICGQRISTDGASFRLTQYIASEYATWFAGRIVGGNFSSTKIQNNQSKVVVSGNAIRVPEILLEQPGVDRSVLVDCQNPLEPATPKIGTYPDYFKVSQCARAKSDYDMCFPVNKWSPGNFFREECNFQTRMYSYFYSATPFYNYFSFDLPSIKGLTGSTFEPEIWSFQSDASSSRSSCLGTVDYLGAVNSNSLLFDAYPPLLINGQLNYRVASPHLNSTSRENKGVFELQLNSDVLRCMYNFTKAPIEVKVAIIADDGETQIATTNWSENGGTARLTISGFHFSSPKLNISFSQKNNSKEKAVLCQKGKIIKQVLSSSQPCPKGFKKL